MKLIISSYSLSVIVWSALSLAACGRLDDNDDTGTAVDSQMARRGSNHRDIIPAPSSSASMGGSAASASNASASVDAIVAAAQTPDGSAIPQGASSDGGCPPVLVALGFWSCPVLGEVCSFQANGAGHNCLCQRTDGEGQYPSWVCDQF